MPKNKKHKNIHHRHRANGYLSLCVRGAGRGGSGVRCVGHRLDIVNTKDIVPNEEVIVAWHGRKQKGDKALVKKTAFDVVKAREAKRRRK